MKRKLELSGMRSIGYFILFFCASVTAFGQGLERYNWYFGNSANAIRFNRTTAKASILNNAHPQGTGGSITVSDPANGNLLFYSDGQFVYDANHLQMPAGSGLSGNASANQPVAVCPVPGAANKNKYFVFTNSASYPAAGTITYSVVDMNLFGNAAFPSPASGDIELPKNRATGLVGRAEGMMIIPHANGTDFWLISQQANSFSISATLINAAAYTSGVGPPVVSNITQVGTSVANFAWHAGKKLLAISPQDPGTIVYIASFDNATGAGVTLPKLPNGISGAGNNTVTNQNIYDTEFSLSGDYIYISVYGEAGVKADLKQYDLVNANATLISVLPAPVFRSYGVQMAPDSNIYHLYQVAAGGPILTGKIQRSNAVATQVNYSPAAFSGTAFGGTQFPSFAPKTNVTITVSFTSTGTCQNNNTTFFPDIQPGADSVNWDFGDSTPISNDWSPVHKYATAQTFNVKLTAFYEGQQQSTTQPITITKFALKLTLPQDTTACSCELKFQKANPAFPSCNRPFKVKVQSQGGTSPSYVWSTGAIGQTLNVDSAGYYYVIATDASSPGCQAYAGVTVKEYQIQDQRSNIWQFGNKAGIDFNKPPAKALSNSAMNAPEGCAIICDRNGQTIFYTDGDKVFNKKDALIASGIGGNVNASQSAIIVPVQGDETLYYIFTNEDVGSAGNVVKYSLFDIKLNNGLGGLVIQNQTLFSRSTERITASGKWLIIHERGNATFRVYPVSSTGIGDPILSDIGSVHGFSPSTESEGYMKLGPKNMLAVALSLSSSTNLVELFHLNDSTGKLTNYRKITLKQNGVNGQVYGIEFGGGGNKLFASLKGSTSPSQLHEYFIDSIGHPYFRNRSQNNSEIGALQLAPDGQIYAAINGSGTLATIQPVADTTKTSPINFSGFPLASGTKSGLGLPNFIQQISTAFGGPDMTASGFCLGSPTKFVATPTDAIDKFSWNFGDGGGFSDPTTSPADTTHTYQKAGTYTAIVNITNRCPKSPTDSNTNLFSEPRPIVITVPPPLPSLPSIACNQTAVLNANPSGLAGLSYAWIIQQDGGLNNLTVNPVTLNNVKDFVPVALTITDSNGCTSHLSQPIGPPLPLDLGPDLTICELKDAAGLTTAVTPPIPTPTYNLTYTWTINGAVAAVQPNPPSFTATSGVYTFKVTGTDPTNTLPCPLIDDVLVTVNPAPTVTTSFINPSACLGSDGSLSVQLSATAPPTGPYSVFVTTPGFNQQLFDKTPQTLTFNGLKAGSYGVTVLDQITTCSFQGFPLLTDATWTANASPVNNCDPLTFSVTSTAVALPLTYTVQGGSAAQNLGPFNSPTANFVTAQAITATPGIVNSYTISIKDAAGCVGGPPVLNVTPSLPVPITITPAICGTPATITAAGATSYSWTGPNILGASNGPTIQVSGQGTFTYTVKASAAGSCDNTQTTTVTLDTFVPDFTQSDPCQTQVTLSSTPSGNFGYRWYKGGAIQPLVGPSISLGTSEDGSSYQVELVSVANGCAVKSTPKTINVVGIVDAGLTVGAVCKDNKPFTLTAVTTATGTAYAWYKNNTVLAGLTTPSITQQDEARYKVEVTKSVCRASSQLTIIRNPLPVGTLPNQVIICNDPENKDPKTNQVDLDPGTFTSYNWLKNDLPLSYTSQVYTATSQGKYTVDLTNIYGCIAQDEVIVRNECIPKIDVPNAFRPASTISENKEFYIFSYFITDANFQIFLYNRWGELVYTSSDRYFKWNGGYNNQLNLPVPGGSYAYVIKYVSAFHPERGVQEQRGGILLLR